MAATNVHFSFKDARGNAKTGTLRISPVRRHVSGTTVIVQGGFETKLANDGTATVALDPTDNTFAWKIEEFPDDPACAFARIVQVPASDATVEYTSLTDVDENTLTPARNTGAALTYLLASSLSEAQAMSAANPGQLVFYPEGQTKTVASQILEDLANARAVVESQSAVAAQAANTAQAASDASQAASAQVAQTAQQVSEAAQQVSTQSGQVSANADAVQAVTDGINETKGLVESHANDALTAIDEAVKPVQDKAADATTAIDDALKTVQDKATDAVDDKPTETPAAPTADSASQEA